MEQTLIEFICDGDNKNRVQRFIYTVDEMLRCYEKHGDKEES